jgi:hypothetical protein
MHRYVSSRTHKSQQNSSVSAGVVMGAAPGMFDSSPQRQE